jgi:hypothetical protein
MEYDNTNKGALFQNDRKESDRHPDYRGQINVDGVEYWLSAWIKTISKGPRRGEEMVSLSVTPKEETGRPSGPPKSDKARTINRPSAAGERTPELPIDDDIPF